MVTWLAHNLGFFNLSVVLTVLHSFKMFRAWFVMDLTPYILFQMKKCIGVYIAHFIPNQTCGVKFNYSVMKMRHDCVISCAYPPAVNMSTSTYFPKASYRFGLLEHPPNQHELWATKLNGRFWEVGGQPVHYSNLFTSWLHLPVVELQPWIGTTIIFNLLIGSHANGLEWGICYRPIPRKNPSRSEIWICDP